jgi:hypothetical protein
MMWNWFQQVHSYCINLQNYLPPNIRNVYQMTGCGQGVCWDFRDDCIASWFFPAMRRGVANYVAGLGRFGFPLWYYFPEGPFNPTHHRNPICLTATCTPGGPIVHGSGTIFLDRSCNQVPNAPGGQECDAGSVIWRSSPISLLWDDSADLDADIRVVEFALNPSGARRWVLWKGSAKTPLLVYDPAHTGKIENGTQLFGDWTFGGQRKIEPFKPVALDTQPSKSAKPWSNGYEALAALDFNDDGVISGKELEPLGLWFDRNQNAISEPGEVTPVTEAHVSQIFTDGYVPGGGPNALTIKRGFRRNAPGEEPYYGASVD